MVDEAELLDAFEQRKRRRESRRDFFRAFGAVAAVTGGVAAAGLASPAAAQAALTDGDVLNFALNLEYLEANFYNFAAFGTGLPANLTGGTGNAGAATGGRRVNFSDAAVASYAREIAQDELAHVTFIRNTIGSTAIAQPTIDLGTDPNGAFSSAARAAGLVGAGQSFDPYADDQNYLLGSFVFADVGVSAYRGSAASLSNKTVLEASAGILAVEAYHAAITRTLLYQRGIATPAVVDATEAISNARDSLDGATDLDQGIRNIGTASNIVPVDANSLAIGRTPGQVLNVVFQNRAAVSRGGFFPNGVNGRINLSAAN